MSIKYELKFRTKGFPWELFDDYKEKDDPELKKYHDLLSKTKFNGGVRVIKVETTRKEVKI